MMLTGLNVTLKLLCLMNEPTSYYPAVFRAKNYLELLMFFQQSVVLPGEALHLLLHYISLRLGLLQVWRRNDNM